MLLSRFFGSWLVDRARLLLGPSPLPLCALQPTREARLPSRARVARLTALLFVAVLVSACGGDSSPTTPEDDDPSGPAGPFDVAIPFGQGLASSVYAIGSFDGQIVAGGGFRNDLVSGDELNGVARWDGTNWKSMASGLPGGVEALVEYGDGLYAGGYFSASEGSSVSYLARWNGTVWEPDGRPNGPVFAFLAVPGRLVVGGDFTQLGREAQRVAIRDDDAWRPLGDGFDALVSALGYYRNEIYSGGSFV